MKIQLSHLREKGNALLMVFILALITVPIVWGLLDINIRTQNRSVVRSQIWNGVLPLVEAGVEEALAHLNRNCYSNLANNGVVQWYGIDGWTQVTDGVYQAERKYLGDSYYDLVITTNAPADARNPEIICTAYTPSVLSKITSIPLYAAIGQSIETVPTVARRVKVSAVEYKLFLMGMLAEGNVVMNGRGGLDSFDSQSPTNSFYGIYDARYRNDQAEVGSTDGNINLGSGGVVYGQGSTSPSGTLTNGTVGDEEYIDGGNTGIQDGHYDNDLNLDLLDVELPEQADSWSILYPFNNWAVITNPVREAKILVSPTYPNPPPPGGVIATNSAIVTTAGYPNPVPATGVSTNISYRSATNLPTPLPTVIVTNFGWVAEVSQFPTYPTSFMNPPGVVTNTQRATNINIYPTAGTYLGTVVSNYVDPKKQGHNNAYSEFIYNKITSYSYRKPVTESYTWEEYTYTYLKDETYKYIGVVTNQEVVRSYYKYLATPGNYQMQGLTLSGQDRMLIRAPGHTTLYIKGPISMSGQSQIILEYGASLSIYVSGDVDLGGQGIMNENDNALNFTLYGLPSCRNISISGNASLTGSIYAPQADIRGNGGGNDRHDIIGAIVGRTIRFNGHFQLHYDEALGRIGPSWGFVANSWAEVPVD